LSRAYRADSSRPVLSGNSIYRLKEIMGHSSVQVTERYAHLTNQLTDAELARAHVQLVREAHGETAGVIGDTRFSYDVWGDAVRTAALLENTSASGRIIVAAFASSMYRMQILVDLAAQFVCAAAGLGKEMRARFGRKFQRGVVKLTNLLILFRTHSE